MSTIIINLAFYLAAYFAYCGFDRVSEKRTFGISRASFYWSYTLWSPWRHIFLTNYWGKGFCCLCPMPVQLLTVTMRWYGMVWYGTWCVTVYLSVA